jgi:hypothetical protein
LPLRRQQAGNPASGSDANAAGEISEMLKKANKTEAIVRRMTTWYLRRDSVVNGIQANSATKPVTTNAIAQIRSRLNHDRRSTARPNV